MPLTAQSSSDGVLAWIHACQTAYNAGELDHLASLLDAPPEATPLYQLQFYRGLLAVAHGKYLIAKENFILAGIEAHNQQDTDVWQRSLIWQAYCHSQVGNYPSARILADQAIQLTHGSALTESEVLFLRGLIAADADGFKEAQAYLEQAREVALRVGDKKSEVRYSLNLAAIYVYQGLIDQALHLVHRARQMPGELRPQQWIQAQLIELFCLRLQGNLAEASSQVSTASKDYARNGGLFEGWLALAHTSIAVDDNQFSLAEDLWHRARKLLEFVEDNDFSRAELNWERAWMHLRQGHLDQAHEHIQQSLRLIHNQMGFDHLHAWVIAAIIDMHRGDLGTVERNLYEAYERFRAVGHHVGRASTLFHLAAYLLQRPGRTHHATGQRALAEALMLLREYRLYGTYYWHPATMARLCYLAMQDDFWGENSHLILERVLVGAKLKGVEQHPADGWAEFATSLAARRLATTHWETFLPLLNNPQPKVRRRAAQVILSAATPTALNHLETLQLDSDPEVQQWVQQHLPPRHTSVRLQSFGPLELYIHGKPLKLANSGSRKAVILFTILMVMGPTGIDAADLALLLSPHLSPASRKNALHSTKSTLAKTLKGALGYNPIETYEGRYALVLEGGGITWDWLELRAAFLRKDFPVLGEALKGLASGTFLVGLDQFLTSQGQVPTSTALTQDTSLWDEDVLRWDNAIDLLTERVEVHRAELANWEAEVMEADAHKRSPEIS